MEIQIRHYSTGKMMVIHTSRARCALLGYYEGEEITHTEHGKGVVLGVGPQYVYDAGVQAGEDVLWVTFEKLGNGAVPLLLVDQNRLSRLSA